MRAVFGFELAPTRGALDPAKRLMDAVFDAFVHERARAGDDAARVDVSETYRDLYFHVGRLRMVETGFRMRTY